MLACASIGQFLFIQTIEWPNDGFQMSTKHIWMNEWREKTTLLNTNTHSLKMIIIWWKPNQFIIMQIFTFHVLYILLCHRKKIRHTHNDALHTILCYVLMKRTKMKKNKWINLKCKQTMDEWVTRIRAWLFFYINRNIDYYIIFVVVFIFVLALFYLLILSFDDDACNLYLTFMQLK